MAGLLTTAIPTRGLGLMQGLEVVPKLGLADSENSLSLSARNDSQKGSSEGSAPLARTRGVLALSTW
jgi:hypothetical protein